MDVSVNAEAIRIESDSRRAQRGSCIKERKKVPAVKLPTQAPSSKITGVTLFSYSMTAI